VKEIVSLIGEIVKQILELFGSYAPEENTTFDDIETQVRSVMLEIGRRIRVETVFSHKQPAPESEIDSVKRGYTGVDGVMVPKRTLEGYKEMKVVTTYDKA
jgi:hypothetical protein